MSETIDVNSLYERFKDEFVTYFKRFESEGEKAVAYVLSRILYVIVPKMMVVVGKYKALGGQEKKILVSDTVVFAIDNLFEELNVNTQLSKESWDEHVRDILLITVPSTIDSFISIEKGRLVFNPKKPFSFLSCCK